MDVWQKNGNEQHIMNNLEYQSQTRHLERIQAQADQDIEQAPW